MKQPQIKMGYTNGDGFYLCIGINLFTYFFHFSIYKLCKDFCGVVTEQSMKSNYGLINELISEILVSLLWLFIFLWRKYLLM